MNAYDNGGYPAGCNGEPAEHPLAELAEDADLYLNRAARKAALKAKQKHGLTLTACGHPDCEVRTGGFDDKLFVSLAAFNRLTVPASSNPLDAGLALADAIEEFGADLRAMLLGAAPTLTTPTQAS